MGVGLMSIIIGVGISCTNQTNTNKADNSWESKWVQFVSFELEDHPTQYASIVVPQSYYTDDSRMFPVLILFSGATEANQPSAIAAQAWIKKYDLLQGLERLSNPPLQQEDFKGYVTPEALADYNQRLAKHPYNGCILITPSTYPMKLPSEGTWYESFIFEELIPYVDATYRTNTKRVGIHGISLGGAVALYFGLQHPEQFYLIGALQPAVQYYQNTFYQFIQKNQAQLRQRTIHLVTSTGDTHLRPLAEEQQSLFDFFEIPTVFRVIQGSHDYVFNRGPGLFELLITANEVLYYDKPF